MNNERVKAWLRQARADLEAGRSGGGTECHRRYWLQQTCEKGLKALALVMWKGPSTDEGWLRAHYLNKHSPLRQLSLEVNANPACPKSLRLLLMSIQTELGKLDGEGLLQKVDATTPSTAPTEVSYRYPFQDDNGIEVAPQDWTTTDWDTYQGNQAGVIATLERFLRAVENRRQRERGPF